MNRLDILRLQRKTATIKAMVSPDTRKLAFDAAKISGITLSEYLRECIYALIKREIPSVTLSIDNDN